MTFIGILVVLIIAVVIIWVAALALRLTGLDDKRATFQAVSAFTGTGFTTKDAELIVGHDMRRKIVMALMILGNVGLITVIAQFAQAGAREILLRTLGMTGAVLAGTWGVLRFTGLSRLIRKWSHGLERYFKKTDLVQPVLMEEVFYIAEGYGAQRVRLQPGSTLCGKSLAQAALTEKKVIVLAIWRGEQVIAAPRGTDMLMANDQLICYGAKTNIKALVS